ncbi:hypothetical protein ACLB2K_072328 [Fragaria x ananassa]
MAGSSSSSPGGTGGAFKYDVFINFRGEDTCRACHRADAERERCAFMTSNQAKESSGATSRARNLRANYSRSPVNRYSLSERAEQQWESEDESRWALRSKARRT